MIYAGASTNQAAVAAPLGHLKTSVVLFDDFSLDLSFLLYELSLLYHSIWIKWAKVSSHSHPNIIMMIIMMMKTNTSQNGHTIIQNQLKLPSLHICLYYCDGNFI